jgi:hypothetical protein
MRKRTPLTIVASLAVLSAAGAAFAAVSFNFNSPLEGAQEAPIPRDTKTRGNAIYMLNRDESAIEYMLMVANIENVFMAHIHQGPRGTAGPIVVWLYPSTAPGVQAPKGRGRIDGVIAQGDDHGRGPHRPARGSAAVGTGRPVAQRRGVHERPDRRRRPRLERGTRRLPGRGNSRSDQGERVRLSHATLLAGRAGEPALP